MPKNEDILRGLQSIVDNYSTFAIIWHVIFYFLIATLIAKWRPSNKLFGLIICLPLLSVAVFAWLSGNPFNGTLFTLAFILLFLFGLRADNQSVNFSRFPFMITGILMIIFGLVYPHFLNSEAVFKYLYASPAGLIPCPTLSVLIGFILLYNGLSSPAITLTFIVLGIFFGVFGVVKLGVYFDLFLVFGTFSLIIKYILSLRTLAI